MQPRGGCRSANAGAVPRSSAVCRPAVTLRSQPRGVTTHPGSPPSRRTPTACGYAPGLRPVAANPVIASMRPESDSAVPRAPMSPSGVSQKGPWGRRSHGARIPSRLTRMRRTNWSGDAWKLHRQNLHGSTVKRLLLTVSTMGEQGVSQEFRLCRRAGPDTARAEGVAPELLRRPAS